MIDFLGTPTWSNAGPNPIATSAGLISGAVQAVVAQKTLRAGQPATYALYAATVNGGVWRSDNFVDAMLTVAGPPAIRWRPVSDQTVTLSTSSIALDPLDASGNTVWVGTGVLSSGFIGGPASSLLKTANGKAQAPAWAVLGATPVRAGDVDLAGQRIVSVVPTRLLEAATQLQVVLVAALDGQGILRSRDGGQTFQAVNGPAGALSGRATDLVADPNDPNTFYAAIAAVFRAQVPVSLGGIYRSQDGGSHWVRIDAGLPQINRSASLKLALFNNAAGAVPNSGPTVLYAGQSDVNGIDNNLIGLFRCTNPKDDAPRWTPLFANANPAVIPNGLTAQQWPASALVPWFAMAVDPADWNNLYLGGMSWLYRVRVIVQAGGATATQWANWDNGGGWDHRSLSYIANNILIGTGDPGIFGLANNANAWISLNDSLCVTEFYATAYDQTRGLVCGGAQDVGSPVQDAGGGWRQLLDGGGDGGLALVASDGVYYYETNNTLIRESNRNPVTPAGIPNVGGPRSAAVSPGNPAQLMFARGAQLFETQDRGDHVREVTPAGVVGNISAFAYGADNPNAVYVGTSSGQLYLRVNGIGPPVVVAAYPGAGAQVDDVAVDRTNFRKAALIADDGRVFLTLDAGAHWTNIRGNVGDVVRFMRRIELLTAGDNLVVLIAGDPPAGNAGLARAVNPSTAQANPPIVWTPFGAGLPRAVVKDLRYYPAGQFVNGDPRGDLLLAGTFGRGAWTIASRGIGWNTHDHRQPGNTAVATAPALVRWNQPGVPVRENLFYGGANGRLIEFWFDGNQWNVTDHGNPAGVAVASMPAAVTWTQAGVPIRVNVFYRGGNGNLIELWFDGNQWHVNDHGQPAGTAVASAPTAVTWTQPGVPIRENVFYQGANGNLIEFWFDGQHWKVNDHGKPAGTAVASAPAAVTWTQPGVAIRENVFYRGANGHLIDLWFDGNQWNVRDHGMPGGTAMATAPVAVAWTWAGVPIRENVFFGGANGHLVEVWFDGSQWNVTDHGQPAGTSVAAAPAAVTWREAGGNIRLNVFYEGGNGNLVERWFDGNQWNTTDHGKPAGVAVTSQVAAVTWTQPGGPIRENVFYRGANGNLIELWFG